MRILGIIPARGGSKGVPRKNIRLLGGKPLLAYSIEAALNSKLLTQVVVSTEDQEIADVASSYGDLVPFMRPAALAEDHSSSIEAVVHALQFFSSKDIQFDAVCLIQPTVPFRAQQEIDNSINIFLQKDTDSLISVKQIPHQYNPHWAYLDNAKGHLSLALDNNGIIKRRQELPPAYYRDGSIYITRTAVIIEQKSLYGASTAYYLNNNLVNINIDTEEDWDKAEKYLSSHVD